MSKSEQDIFSPSQLLSEAIMDSNNISSIIIAYVKGDPSKGDSTVHSRWCGGTIIAMGLATNFLNHLKDYMEEDEEEEE